MDSSTENEPQRVGDWIRISVLGSGSFGTVSLWRCTKTNDFIAIKKCKLQCSTSLTPKHKKRWRNEVEIMKEIDNLNIVKYKPIPEILEQELSKYNPSNLPLLPMEYCAQGNLRHFLTQPLNMCGLSEINVKHILMDITNAVSYLHSRNITHRDIKPENIVLKENPKRRNGILFKLIDLGYAKELSSTVSFVGTLHYLAPEILANKNYDYSVDYWSLGILTFEVICGVLPFMANLSPTERYRLIKEKHPDQICVFKNRMGNYQYSTELFKENQLKSCFKNGIEIWLRKALQFDPQLRKEPFANSINFFQQISMILEKRIVEVFVVHEYQFRSYEFDESTTWLTIRQWLTRDTGVKEEDMMLFGNFKECENQPCFFECFSNDSHKLFLFKRNVLFEIEKHPLPRLVKLMFNRPTEKFPWNEIKAIYTHSIHYIQQDIALADAFLEAIDILLGQLVNRIIEAENKQLRCVEQIGHLMEKVERFNSILQSGVPEVSCLAKEAREFYDLVDQVLNTSSDLSLNLQKWALKVAAMKCVNLRDNLIRMPEIKKFLNEAVASLQKIAGIPGRSTEMFGCGELLRIICKVTKLKDNIFNDKNLKDYVRYIEKSTNYMQYLFTWLDSFYLHIYSLVDMGDSLVKEYEKTRRISQQSDLKKSSIKTGLVNADRAVQQSEILSARFEEIIAESIADYKTIRDDIESYIKDITAVIN